MIPKRLAPSRRLWSFESLSCADMAALMDIARALRRASDAGEAAKPLRGRNLALLSASDDDGEPSEVHRAAADLGARVAHLPAASTPARAPSPRLLGRLYDAIYCEGLDVAALGEVEREAGVPVFDGLANGERPARMLATLLAIEDRAGAPLPSLRIAFVGDPNTPCGDVLIQAAARIGMELRIATSRATWPDATRLRHARRAGRASGARITVTASVPKACRGADVVLDSRCMELAASDAYRFVALQAILLATLA